MRRRNADSRILAMFVAALLFLPPAAWPSQDLLSEPAPDFALKSLAGHNLRLSEFRGEVVLVTFWGVRCGKCREQLAVVDDLFSRHQAQGLRVLGVSIDKQVDKTRATAADLGLQFPVLLDDRHVAARLYDMNELPMTVLVDPHGTVRYVHEGYGAGDAATYQHELEELLTEEPVIARELNL